MSEVKRYNDFQEQTENGYWVRYTDHVAALLAEREKVAAKFAAFADENGEPRKVLGTLPVTEDGAIVGLGATIWNSLFPEPNPLTTDPTSVWCEARQNEGPVCGATLVSDKRAWWSTKAAAEAAKEKKS